MTVTPHLFGIWNVAARGWALVDLEQGSVVREGELGFDGNWAAYSPDGDHAVITGYSGEVLVIDLGTGEPVQPEVKAHTAGVFWAAFSPDGSRLVTSATDGTVILWETRTATQLARLKIPVPGQSAVEFLPDGKVLIAPWMVDASLYEWDPSAERAADLACRAAGRELTEQEWRDAFGDLPYQEVCSDS